MWFKIRAPDVSQRQIQIEAATTPQLPVLERVAMTCGIHLNCVRFGKYALVLDTFCLLHVFMLSFSRYCGELQTILCLIFLIRGMWEWFHMRQRRKQTGHIAQIEAQLSKFHLSSSLQ